MSEAVLAAPPSPYKGLAAFADSELDALLFFGREREIEIIAANLIAARLTVLYGPSGVGKTSLLRAGVARRLRSEGAAIVVFSSWSGDPLGGLLAAVEREVRRVNPAVDVPPAGSVAEILASWTRRLGADLYLVLDQFEEYFLYHGGDGDAGPLAVLAEVIGQPGSRVHVVLSIREDALAQLDTFKSQLPGLFGNSLRLDRLDRRAARRAILGPLERYNELVPDEETVEAEDELVDEVLDSVEAGRIQLGDVGRGGTDEGAEGRIEAPYLQLVLERLWEVERERRSRQLRVETLRELGGAGRIVEDHLERAMAALSPGEKDAAAAMYNHLVTPSGTKIAHGAGDLARYAAIDEQEAQRVLERLASERIVRAGEDGSRGPQYEIFHDVLADAVLAWRARHESERRLQEERRHVARRHRQAFWLALASGVAVTILAVAAVYALTQRSSASENEREARAHDLAALAASALLTDPQRGLQLALEASESARSPTIEDTLRRALRALRTTAVIRAGGPVADIAISPDGRALASAVGNAVQIYDADGRRSVRKLAQPGASTVSFSPDGNRILTAGGGVARVWARRGGRLLALRHGSVITRAVFSPSGSVIATGGSDARVRIWNARNGRLRHTLRHRRTVLDASFNHDGKLLVTASHEKVARVFDARNGRLVARLRHPGGIRVARFSPVGRLVATGGSDHLARLWDGRSGKLLADLEGHVRGVIDVAFTADGDLVGTASADGTGRVWNTSDGTLVTILPGHPNWVTRVEFSPDGEQAVTASRDRLARIFDADAGTLRATLAGHSEPVTDVAFGAKGLTVATASPDSTVRIWDARYLPELKVVSRHPSRSPASDVAFAGSRIVPAYRGELTSDGRLGAAYEGDGRIRIAEVESGRVVRTLRNAGEVTAIGFSEDGEALITGSDDGAVRLWRVADGSVQRTVRAGTPITSVALSRDGTRLVAAGIDDPARIWHAETGRLERELPLHTSSLTSASFSPDGRYVLTTGAENDARLYELATGNQLWVLSQASTVSDADFSADGRWIAIAGPGFAGVVDARTGERILLLNGNDRLLTAVAFAPSGWRIATGSDSGVVRMYDCRLCGGIGELVKLAEERLAQLRPTTP